MVPSQGRTKEGGIVVKSSCPPNSKWPVALVKRPVPPVSAVFYCHTPGVSVGQGWHPRACRRFRRRGRNQSKQCRGWYFHKDRAGLQGRGKNSPVREGSQLLACQLTTCYGLHLPDCSRRIPRQCLNGTISPARAVVVPRDKCFTRAGEDGVEKKPCSKGDGTIDFLKCRVMGIFDADF